MTTSTSTARPGGIGTKLREVGADLATTINRLIQAALMNGATEIEIQTGTAVAIVADNGRGAADPAAVLKTVHGLTRPGPTRLPVLLGRGPVIQSQQSDGMRWTAQPTDDEMNAEGAPMGTPDPGHRRMGTGTTVLIDLLHSDGTDTERDARQAARGWPARITVDGCPIEAGA